MSYTVTNFKTKKALKEAVDYYNEKFLYHINKISGVMCYNSCLGPDLSNFTGTVFLEGPHYPEPHRWYAQGEMKDGVLIKVK